MPWLTLGKRCTSCLNNFCSILWYYVDAHEYSPESQLLPFIYFHIISARGGGGYQFVIEFACPLINLKCICHKNVQS